MSNFVDKVQEAEESLTRKEMALSLRKELLRELSAHGGAIVPEAIQVEDEPRLVFMNTTVKELLKEFPSLPLVEVRGRGPTPLYKLQSHHLRQLTGRQLSDVSYLAEYAYWNSLIGNTVWEIRLYGNFKGIPAHPVDITEAHLDAWDKKEAEEAEIEAIAQMVNDKFTRMGYRCSARAFFYAGLSRVRLRGSPLTLEDLPPKRPPADLRMVKVHSPEQAIQALQAYSEAQLVERHAWDRIGNFWAVFDEKSALEFVAYVNKYPYV